MHISEILETIHPDYPKALEQIFDHVSNAVIKNGGKGKISINFTISNECIGDLDRVEITHKTGHTKPTIHGAKSEHFSGTTFFEVNGQGQLTILEDQELDPYQLDMFNEHTE